MLTPRNVQAAKDDGYVLVHSAVLCSMPISMPEDIGMFRTFKLLLEACFSSIFWPMRSKEQEIRVSSPPSATW